MSDLGIESSDVSSESQPIKLYRGIWAESINNGQLIPVGGSSHYNDELSINLLVDYDAFDRDLENYTQKALAHYETNKQQIIEWLKTVGTDIDPFLFYACNQAQLKMEAILQVNRDEPDEPTRRELYTRNTAPKLSELKGKSACAEQAILGKHILKLIGVDAVYMSGITMISPENPDPENHSFLVIKDPDKPGSIIFDIAKPKSQQNLPRLLRTDFPITADTFIGKQHDVVRGTDVLDKKQLYYGVGNPMLNVDYSVVQN